MIAEELELGDRRVERVRLAGVLHDVGKVGVPDDVLRKAGPLDEREWEEMRKHCELGARLLGGAGLEDIAAWVLAHHERPDSGGS
jgi:HD-GYP domain-containing protein (c-di-GMP phosphodiesterase class II)